MYTGHFAVALGGAGLSRRIPLWLFIVAAFASDLVDAVLKVAGVHDPTRVWSHSLPAATAAGVVLALAWRASGGSTREAALVCVTAMSHTALDFITGIKTVWPGVPPMGLDLYHRPLTDGLVETACAVAGWWLWRRSVPAGPRMSAYVPAVLATLLIAQGASTAHLVTRAPDVGSDGQPYRTVRDTIADTIVARTTGDVPQRLVHGLMVEWRAGANTDAPGAVAGIGEVAVSPDGRVYVWDPRTPALQYYDAAGRFQKTIGRPGGGPGEYTTLNGLTVLPDGRLVAWDMGNARLNVYTAEGVPVLTWRAPVSGFGTSGALQSDVHSRVWAKGLIPSDDGSWGALGRGAWFLIDTTGAVVDTVLQPTAERGDPPLIARRGANVSSYPRPFGRTQLLAVSSSGSLVWGPSDPYRVYTTHANRPLRIERAWTPVRVLPDERAQHRASAEWSMRQSDPAWTWQGSAVPTVKPAYTHIAVGLDGRIWVTVSVESQPLAPEVPPTGSPTGRPQIRYRPKADWRDVYEPNGRYLGRVFVPRHVRVYAMRGDFVWGAMLDANDQPSLVRMRVIPGFGR